MKLLKKLFGKKKQFSKKLKGEGNIVILPKKFEYKKLKIRLNGNHNVITIGENACLNCCVINIYGNDNNVFIDENVYAGDISISLGQNHPNFGYCNCSKLWIGKRTSIESAKFITYNSNTSIIIGEDCMLAYDIVFYNTDAHPIYEKDTNKLINLVNDINIGNHCWIGAKATILKNVKLADWTIVGYGSIVAKSFVQSNIAIAGNPAKVVKEGIDWARDGSKDYIPNLNFINREGKTL